MTRSDSIFLHSLKQIGFHRHLPRRRGRGQVEEFFGSALAHHGLEKLKQRRLAGVLLKGLDLRFQEFGPDLECRRDRGRETGCRSGSVNNEVE